MREGEDDKVAEENKCYKKTSEGHGDRLETRNGGRH